MLEIITTQDVQFCERYYPSRRYYLGHMAKYHKDGKREPIVDGMIKQRMDPNIIPIWKDPNNYCRSCKQAYAHQEAYQRHIKKFHSDVLQQEIQLSVLNSSQ